MAVEVVASPNTWRFDSSYDNTDTFVLITFSLVPCTDRSVICLVITSLIYNVHPFISLLMLSLLQVLRSFVLSQAKGIYSITRNSMELIWICMCFLSVSLCLYPQGQQFSPESHSTESGSAGFVFVSATRPLGVQVLDRQSVCLVCVCVCVSML